MIRNKCQSSEDNIETERIVSKAVEHPNFHVAVQLGMVTVSPVDDVNREKVRWNMDLIRQVWAADTEYKTIKSFCDNYGLSYSRVRMILRVDDKKAVDEHRVKLGQMIMNTIALPDQKVIKDAGELISHVLGNSLDNINALNLYVTSRLVNVTPDGKRITNIKLEPETVGKLALIQKRATDQISRLLETQNKAVTQNEVPEDPVYVPESQDIPEQRDVIARITAGGIADVKPADGQKSE